MADEQDKQGAQIEKKSGGLMSKLLIAGFMGAVVAVECLLAYLFIPSAEQVAKLAEQRMAKRLPASMVGDSPDQLAGETNSMVEVELGDFSITVPQSGTTSLRVDFHLCGTVVEQEANELRSLFDRNVHRFRDQIVFEIRNSEPADLADPGLGLIKRRILEKSNALFGKPILRSVIFPQFSYVEQ